MKINRRWIGRQMARSLRGRWFAQLGIFFTTSMLYMEEFVPGLSFEIMAFISLFIATFGTVFIGYIDERWGVWPFQMEHQSLVNPVARETLENTREIKKALRR